MPISRVKQRNHQPAPKGATIKGKKQMEKVKKEKETATKPATKTVNIPNFPADVWNNFRYESIRTGRKHIDTIVEAIELWLEHNKK